MKRFQDISIRRKLAVAMALNSTAALLLAALTAITYEIVNLRHMFQVEMPALAETVAAGSGRALATGDAAVLKLWMASLRTHPEIQSAAIFTADDQLLANYVRAGERLAEQFPVRKPVLVKGQVAGWVGVRPDLSEWWERVRWGIGILALGLIGAAALGVWWLGVLQRHIAEPVLELAGVAERVGREHDYSLRAAKHGADEVGLLTDAFHRLLSRLEQNRARLEDNEARLRALLDQLPASLWTTDRQLTITSLRGAGLVSIGLLPNQLVGTTIYDVFRTRDANHPQVTAHRHALEGQQVRRDVEYAQRILRTHIQPFRDSTGQITGTIGAALDVTEQRQLEREVLQISDRERSRIGQDLHDGLCQQLVSLTFACTALGTRLETAAPAEVPAIGKLLAELDGALAHAHGTAHALYPVKLEVEGLTAALGELAQQISDTRPVACILDCPVPVRLVDHGTGIHLYRIAQEAVTNAVKHARAQHIWIRLHLEAGLLIVQVEDDGTGLADYRELTAGMGVNIMQYRARMIGATLELGRRPAGGTAMVCRCPLPATLEMPI